MGTGVRSAAGAVITAAALLGAAAPAQAGPFVYVANASGGPGGGVSQYDAGADGLLAPLSPAFLGSGVQRIGVAVSPDGSSVYVTNTSADSVAQFDVGVGGALTPKSPATVSAGDSPAGIALSPDGTSAYVVNVVSDNVSQYDVGAGGALAPKTPATVAAGDAPLVGIAVSPDGDSAYVVNENSDNISQYDVGAGGALSPKSPATVATGDFPRGLAVSPDGNSVYVTSLNTDNVFQYDVGSNGTLTPKSPATVAAGNVPWQVTVSPDGDSAYVTNELDDSVSQYNVGAGGALAAKTPATVPAGDFPEGLAVSADGESVYVANSGSNSMSQYNVAGGGLLSAKFPATVPAGDFPTGVAVGPPECGDTRDNDGDGSSDFPDDPSCTSATDPGEASFMFGKAAVGSAFSPMSSNVKRASPSLLWFGPVTVTGFRAYLDGGGALSGSQVVKAVLYRHQGGPNQLVAQSLAKTIVAGRIDGFVDFELPTPVSLDPGYYWLGLHSGATHGIARFGWNFGTQVRVYNIDWFADGASNPFGGNTFQDDQVITMYAVGHKEASGTQ